MKANYKQSTSGEDLPKPDPSSVFHAPELGDIIPTCEGMFCRRSGHHEGRGNRAFEGKCKDRETTPLHQRRVRVANLVLFKWKLA